MPQLKTSILYAVIALTLHRSSAEFNCDTDFVCKLRDPTVECADFAIKNVLPLKDHAKDSIQKLAKMENQIKTIQAQLKKQLTTIPDIIEHQVLTTNGVIFFWWLFNASCFGDIKQDQL